MHAQRASLRGSRALNANVRLPVYYAMPIAIGLGYSGGVVLSYLCGKWIVIAINGPIAMRELKRNIGALLGIVGGVAALLPGLFLATVGGGTLGGSYGEYVSSSIGLGMAGVPVGLGLGICVVTTVVTSAGVLVGAAIGKVVNALTFRSSAT